jgi:glycosyltransferase involved in cell wall biosynthesis
MVRNAYYAYNEPVAYRRATLRERMIVRYGRAYLGRLSSGVALIVQSAIMKQRLKALYNLNSSRIVILPDSEALPPGQAEVAKTEVCPQSEPFTFLCLGDYAPHKNQEILLEAVERVPAYTSRKARCIITISDAHPGGRNLLGQIEQRKLGNVLINSGPLYGAQLERAYMHAQAAIQPTLLETFGRVYAESMCFGLPILTSDRDFARARCQDAAVYFDPLNADNVARAMARVMEDEELRRRLVENGRRIQAEAPTWDEIAGRFVDVLERAAKGQLTLPAESVAARARHGVPLPGKAAFGRRFGA